MYEVIDRAAFDEADWPAGAPKAAAQSGTRLALVGGFLPRRCGIATFTTDIHDSLKRAAPDLAVDIYAMTPATDAIAFDPETCSTITEGEAESFADAARRIEASGADVIWLQHEFGLFGGLAGDMIFELVDRISAPLIVTLHTVLADPDADQMRVMQRLIASASKLVVMSECSRLLLRTLYAADDEQIVVIPHGVPDRPFGRTQMFKAPAGLVGRDVVMTFGLLSPGKGIEAAIAALPAVIADCPDILYCIVGATHPNLLAREGEAYRERLQDQAKALGVEAHIKWIDAFLETDALLDLIEAADIYVTPYTGAGQSTSGTLAYAMALGKAVVSTPYVHATELLADGHGILVPFGDSPAIAREIVALLSDRERLGAMQRRAYQRGRQMIWSALAARLVALIDATKVNPWASPIPARVGIDGLLRICDDTGILQHSVHDIPDRAHGYCVDDNARALMLTHRLGKEAEPHRSRLTSIFAAFVEASWNEDSGQFRNFMDYRRNWLEDSGSEDSCGRTLWALGATAREGRSASTRLWAGRLFIRAAPSMSAFRSPRAIAFAMLGADYLLAVDEENAPAMTMLQQGTDRLLALYEQASTPDWHWFEPVLAYDNGRIPEALIRAGIRLRRADATQCGLDTLRWLNTAQIAPAGHFRPVGSDSFGRHHELPRPFDQQPVEAWAAIDAASAAYDLTGDAIWLTHAQRAYRWFSGANDRGLAVGDPHSGTCRDGINRRGLNLNEGAESVLAYQHASCALRALTAKIH
ncbi:glycosyl transferase family 1 [Sphingopyxis lindanitolerans]|uniref:Glycosyl transferase family 1 n=1 Tax=Sphingopyxis lindanitolerans TaxID=2054227 RepID=A0A2S8B519_9SPHN|nr:glycosyltransferase family 4 protein [Sphingopyxis lindanitolerans]PQM27495.1 glycosyl transferase family 1 [Sphingopyxis lindanitolerans]